MNRVTAVVVKVAVAIYGFLYIYIYTRIFLNSNNVEFFCSTCFRLICENCFEVQNT